MTTGVTNTARARSCHLHQLRPKTDGRVCAALIMRAPLSEKSGFITSDLRLHSREISSEN
jgi:hypothetical protein